MSNLKQNFIFNAMYQVLGLIVPLVLTPYISRVLGADGLGIYSYTYSIVYYFMLVALLGMQYYGNRSIAKVRDNKEELSKTFSEIYLLQLIVTGIVTLVYVIFIMAVKQYRIYYIIQLIYVISVAFDINWLYSGLEKFKFTVARSAVIKLLSAISIFIFVKTKDDLWIYTLIMAGSTFLNQVILWPFLFKEVKIKKVHIKDVKKHIKPTIILFIPVLAYSVYNVMDKIMLGKISSVTEVGYYENAEKIVNIPFYVVSALGTVALPRIASLNKQENIETIKEIIIKSLKFILFLLIPIMFGIWTVADYLVPLYLGDEFINSVLPLKILSVILIFKSISQITRQEYLVPMEKDSIYVKSVGMGAVLNFILNLILIPNFKTVGACIATVITEALLTIYQKIQIEKEIKIFENIRRFIFDILLKAAIMFIILQVIGIFIDNQLIKTIVQIISGVLIYIVLTNGFIRKEILPSIKIKAK